MTAPIGGAAAGQVPTKFGAILIDPPVPFECWSDARPVAKKYGWGSNTQRTAASKYRIMTWPDLVELGPALDAIALPDACLFLWVCSPLIPETLRMAEAWGWEYKTVAFTWVKTNRDRLGMALKLGYWTRANAEQVWLFTRGKPQRRSKDVLQALHAMTDYPAESPAVVTYPGPHSAKPEEVQNRIERLVDGPYLEVFARRYRSGWTTIGNELDGLDITESLRRLAAGESLPKRDPVELFEALA